LEFDLRLELLGNSEYIHQGDMLSEEQLFVWLIWKSLVLFVCRYSSFLSFSFIKKLFDIVIRLTGYCWNLIFDWSFWVIVNIFIWDGEVLLGDGQKLVDLNAVCFVLIQWNVVNIQRISIQKSNKYLTSSFHHVQVKNQQSFSAEFAK
jgi:hypothetical protein